MSKYYRANEAADYLKISPSTLRNYARAGLIQHSTTHGGQRVYTQEQLDTYLGTTPTTPNHQTAYYTRASDGNPVLHQTQLELLTQAYGQPTKTYKDNGSGLNENRAGLKRLLEDAQKHQFTRVIVTNPDRLTRFGYSYLEKYFNLLGIELIALEDKSTKSLQEELMQDFMSLIASFSGKYYHLRGHAQKRLLLEQALKQVPNNND